MIEEEEEERKKCQFLFLYKGNGKITILPSIEKNK